MKKLFTWCLVLFTGQLFGQDAFQYSTDFKKILVQTQSAKSQWSYDKLAARFAANDTTLNNHEVLALLIGFTNMPQYKPYEDLALERDIMELNKVNKYKEALALGLQFLDQHPFSIKVLHEVAFAYYAHEKMDSTSYYMYKVYRIYQAMAFSGEGTSPDSPIFALGPADGQDYLRKFAYATLGSMGSGHDKNGNFLDILEAHFRDGTSETYYFVIQHATDKMFGGKSIQELMAETEPPRPTEIEKKRKRKNKKRDKG